MSSNKKISLLLGSAGFVIAAVVLLLFYMFKSPEVRSETFTFTAWFTAFLILYPFLFIGGNLFFKANHPGTQSIMTLAGANLTLIMIGVELFLVLLCNVFLLPNILGTGQYYALTVFVFALYFAAILLIQIVGVVQNSGNKAAIQNYKTVNHLVYAIDAVCSLASGNGWQVEGQIKKLGEQIRFSEGLRNNPELVDKAYMLISELESILQQSASDALKPELLNKMNLLRALASRRG